jgi:hypothetical protein
MLKGSIPDHANLWRMDLNNENPSGLGDAEVRASGLSSWSVALVDFS